ncbi:TetR/AcrR family transcriptional regulator C-terminal domain-containing protein [Nonomuraea sp. NPDC049419]|uniref:TetR/AcrR family transcriptional regulator C-terminal domain-containing protein n=1 Tax=Nonomuraea sp. NPDC049419 TaxID=3155772 RepID=UPI00342B1CEF
MLSEVSKTVARLPVATAAIVLLRMPSRPPSRTTAMDILDIVKDAGADRLTRALADRLARLALAGRLRGADPDLAAEQFLALLLGPLEARTQLGTRTLADAELRAIATSAVDTFARAWDLS